MVPGVPYRYDPSAFPPFAVTVDVALFTIRDETLQVLLIERGGEPYFGAWALPGGFVRPDESLEQAAARELAEETGLSDGAWHLEQLAAYGTPDRDPRMRVVSVAYWAICADLPTPRGGGDASTADLVEVKRIESGAVRLAFDHERIVRDAVERTRSRLEHTALAARFCPPEFTIRDLRRVYETIWGVSLDPGNFQRFVRASGAFERRDPTSMPKDESASRAGTDAQPELIGGPPLPGTAARARRTGRGRPASLWRARPNDPAQPGAALRTFVRRRHPARAGVPASATVPKPNCPHADEPPDSPSSKGEDA